MCVVSQLYVIHCCHATMSSVHTVTCTEVSQPWEKTDSTVPSLSSLLPSVDLRQSPSWQMIWCTFNHDLSQKSSYNGNSFWRCSHDARIHKEFCHHVGISHFLDAARVKKLGRPMEIRSDAYAPVFAVYCIYWQIKWQQNDDDGNLNCELHSTNEERSKSEIAQH